ncbi:T207 protein [Hirschfeldia incana]|nr:T207 protein [Hirschfeldia incana]
MYSSTYSSLRDFLNRIFSCSFFQGSSMAFKDGKDGFVKRVASSFSMRKKKNATSTGGGNGPKLLPRSKSTGSTNYESMKLPAAAKKIQDATRIKPSPSGGTQLPRREKIDDRGGSRTNKKFGTWRSFDDCDSIWLSSDCASPSSLLEERRLSVAFRFSVDESVVSWLSNVANSLNHQEEAASVKDRCRIPRSSKENADKKVSFSPSSGAQLDSENSSASLTNSSHVPSDQNNRTETSLPHEVSAEVLESKSDTKVDEPLFWPYEQRFDWTPEDILKHFSMSPRRKKLLNAKMSAGTSSPRSMTAQLLQARKTDIKDGCKKKLVFNGPVTNASKIPELKRTASNSSYKKSDNSIKNVPVRNGVKRNTSLPSRLRKSSKPCSKVVPIEVAEETIIAEERAKAEITTRKLINRRSKTMLEDDFAFLNDFSIENAVGLGEFKGREGIDSEFNSDTFLFDDSL